MFKRKYLTLLYFTQFGNLNTFQKFPTSIFKYFEKKKNIIMMVLIQLYLSCSSFFALFNFRIILKNILHIKHHLSIVNAQGCTFEEFFIQLIYRFLPPPQRKNSNDLPLRKLFEKSKICKERTPLPPPQKLEWGTILLKVHLELGRRG